MLKMFSSSEVKGQGHEHAKCYNGEDVHFDDVALRFSCFLTAHKNDRQQTDRQNFRQKCVQRIAQ